MSRILYPKEITAEILKSLEWDFIVIPNVIDDEKIKEWYNTVSVKLDYLKFNFTLCPQYVKDTVNNYFLTDQNDYKWSRNAAYEKLHNSYSLTWFDNRDVPLPPPWAANLDYFQELKEYYDSEGNLIKDFDYSNNMYLEQYNFGEWNLISEKIKNYIFNPRISEHLPGHVLDLHTDGYIARMHIPITNDNSKFYWGETWDREYKFEPGNVYLINSRIPHGTTNFGPVRANIMADIYDNKILDLIQAWK